MYEGSSLPIFSECTLDKPNVVGEDYMNLIILRAISQENDVQPVSGKAVCVGRQLGNIEFHAHWVPYSKVFSVRDYQVRTGYQSTSGRIWGTSRLGQFYNH